MRYLRLMLSFLMAMLPARNAHATEFEKNEQVRSIMRQHGDDCLAARPIQHFAYFPGRAEQQSYREFLISRGYNIEQEYADADGPYPWKILFSKVQIPAAIDDETGYLEDNSQRLHGVYDGWETDNVHKP